MVRRMRRGLACVLAATAATVIVPSARAEVVDDNPAASSRGPGQVSVFSRAADGALLTSELSNGAFTPWRSLGGYLDSGPGAGGRDATTSDVFVRGGDGALYHQFFTSAGGWSGWGRLGHTMLSAPATSLRRGTGYIDVAWRGADNGIEFKSWVPGQGWTDANTTAFDPGLTLSAPALVSRGNGLVDVLVRGTTDRVYINVWNGSAWSGWLELPGGMLTQHAPAATVRTLGTLDVFVRSNTGEVRWTSWDGAAWSDWKTVPGGVDSAPAVVAETSARMWLFARRGGEIVYNVYDSGRGPQNGWDGWRPAHPPAPPPPGCDLAAGRLTAHAKLVRFGKRPRLAGRARRTDGAPQAGAIVTATPRRGGWSRTATADPNGYYSMRLPAGPTRRINVQALAPNATALSCAMARVRTRAGVTLRATRRVRPRGRVRFRGRLKGRPVPARGKLVELQAFDAGRWRTFAQPRSRQDGRFRAAYRLRRTFGPRTFRFRARVRRESGYPYELGYSRKVTVRVR